MTIEALFEKHQDTLNKAVEAIHNREYWSAYPEMPSGRVYGETANKDGENAFKGYLNKPFELDMPGVNGTAGAERSPYGFDLGISYQTVDLDVLLPAMKEASKAWRDVGVKGRAAICLEILERLNKRSFEIGYSVMHTSGQGFMMAFQAGAPHAQDRGLEAVAYAYDEMGNIPETVVWDKPQGKHPSLKMEKRYHVIPRGVGLVVGCSTFPTWNTYPGMFASLATGNAVAIKPHGGAILPAAISAQVAQEVLVENGLPAHIVSLVVDPADAPLTKELATRPEVGIIDYTGNSEFGVWLEENAKQAQVYAEKAGLNTIIIDDFDDVKGMSRNMAFTLSLYSGQMCTTSQNIYIPRDGINTPDGKMSFDEVANLLATGVTKFLSDPERAATVLGAIQSEATHDRTLAAADLGEVVLEAKAMENPWFKDARVLSPTIIKLDAGDEQVYCTEQFGPISFVIATDSTEHSIERAREMTKQHGAITWGVYSSNEEVLNATEEAAMDAGVALSINLTGGVFVNQSAAYSDFHATGANPAANASLADSAFVANRFRVVQSRRHID